MSERKFSPEDIAYVTVKRATDKLTEQELAAFGIHVMTDQDCSRFAWYKHVEHLFTEHGKMHSMTNAALQQVIAVRLPEPTVAIDEKAFAAFEQQVAADEARRREDFRRMDYTLKEEDR